MNEFLTEVVKMMEMMDPCESMEATIGEWHIEIATRTYMTPVVREITFTRAIEPEEVEEGGENDE